MLITKCSANPIVTGGRFEWRRVGTFNPAVIYDNGKFYMLERAVGGLRPFICSIGLLESTDGVTFTPVSSSPVFTAQQLGYENGTVEDPRVVKIDGKFYMTYAYRPYTYNCYPTGVRVPDYTPLVGELDKGVNHTLSGIAESSDLKSFTQIATINPNAEVDERDNVLFPEKIGGRFALLRRPKGYVGEKYGCSGPSIWISYSEDLKSWTDPALVAAPRYDWEGGKIGAGATPVKTSRGWLLLYHGVDPQDTYRVGAMLLDLNHPEKVLARTRGFIMEPTEYYEKFGLVIPNVIFPTGCVEKDGTLYIYYGCCDTAIGLATANLEKFLDELEGGRL